MAMITERGIKGDLCEVLFVWAKYFSIYHIALCVVASRKQKLSVFFCSDINLSLILITLQEGETGRLVRSCPMAFRSS